MPASTCKQLRKAYAAAGRGEDWAKEMIEKTSEAMKKRCGRAQRNRKRRFSTKQKGD